jgi:hypothetical protein
VTVGELTSALEPLAASCRFLHSARRSLMLRGRYLEARASESRRADGRAALALELMLLRTAWANFVTGGVTLDIVEIGDATAIGKRWIRAYLGFHKL